MTTSNFLKKEIDIANPDGSKIASTLFENENSKSVMIVIPATGVKKRFYLHFCQFFAEQGHTVLTFDFRGIGESKRFKLKDRDISMKDWINGDTTTVVNWVKKNFSKQSIHVVGHSLGGQILPFLPNNDLIDGIAFVAATNAYLGYYPLKTKLKFLLATYLGPVLIALRGYLPGFLFGGDDLPAGVGKQWSRWMRKKEYIFSDAGKQLEDHSKTLTGNIRAYAIEDDEISTDIGIATFLKQISFNPKKVITVSPKELGMRSIGHFGFFRKNMRDNPLWNELSDWSKQTAH